MLVSGGGGGSCFLGCAHVCVHTLCVCECACGCTCMCAHVCVCVCVYVHTCACVSTGLLAQGLKLVKEYIILFYGYDFRRHESLRVKVALANAFASTFHAFHQ